MGSISSYVEYFRMIYENNLDLKSFFVMDINEMLEKLRGDIQYPAMVIHPVSGTLDYKNDTIIDSMHCSIMFIDRSNNNIWETLDKLKIIGDSIFFNAINEHCQGFKFYNEGVKNFV